MTTTKKKSKGPKVRCQCPECPDVEPYDSYAKFTAHWNLRHSKDGLVRPERSAVEEILEPASPEDDEEDPGTDNNGQGFGDDIPNVSYETLPEDPVRRLAVILDVHQVPKAIRNSIVAIAKLHPDYTTNQVNLNYLLATKLDRKSQQAIPMIMQEFINPGASADPMNPGMLMLGGGMQPGMMQPNMWGMNQMYPQFNQMYGPQPFMQQPPYYVQPRAQGAPAPKSSGGDDEGGLKGQLGLLAELAKVIQTIGGGSNNTLEETLKEMRQTVEKLANSNREEREALVKDMNQQIKEITDTSREQLETVKTQLHETQLGHLQGQVNALQGARAEEMSEGLGSMVQNVGEGVGAEMQGVRESLQHGLDNISGLLRDVIQAPSQVLGGQRQTERVRRTSVADAAEIMQLEDEIAQLANDIIVETATRGQMSDEQIQEAMTQMDTEGAGG